jgi:hypothetical protein
MGKKKDLKKRNRRCATAAELARNEKKRDKKKEDEKQAATLARNKATNEWTAKYWSNGSGVDKSAGGVEKRRFFHGSLCNNRETLMVMRWLLLGWNMLTGSQFPPRLQRS